MLGTGQPLCNPLLALVFGYSPSWSTGVGNAFFLKIVTRRPLDRAFARGSGVRLRAPPHLPPRDRAIEKPVLQVTPAIARSRAGGGPERFPCARANLRTAGGEHAPEDFRDLATDYEAVEAVGRAVTLEWQSSCGAISG